MGKDLKYFSFYLLKMKNQGKQFVFGGLFLLCNNVSCQKLLYCGVACLFPLLMVPHFWDKQI